MANVRLIARLDIKGPNLIKGVHLEGLRVVGDPQAFAERYYQEGIDELIYMDIVASLYGRNSLLEIGVLAGVILVLSISALLLRRREREPTEEARGEDAV